MEKGNEIIFIGHNLPINLKNSDLETNIIREDCFYRAAHQRHGQYKEVLFLEYNLADFLDWPIILDEMIRLINHEGTIKIKLRISSNHFSIASFNNRLYVSLEKIKLLDFQHIGDDVIIHVFVKRKKKVNSDLNYWSFGVIWNGENKNYLEKFIKSIKEQSRLYKYEILIAGPYCEIQDQSHCHFLEVEELDNQLSNISEKKNLIVKNACFENICIVHNRYTLKNNFIESFEKFGLDFDVVVVKQFLYNGRRVPDWIGHGSDFIFTQNYLFPYGKFIPYQYVGGGMMIAKKDLLKKIPWNVLGVWNTGEDVEISKRFRDYGVQIRFNPFTEAEVLNLREGILEDFAEIKTLNTHKINYDIFSSQNYNIKWFIRFLYFKLKNKLK